MVGSVHPATTLTRVARRWDVCPKASKCSTEESVTGNLKLDVSAATLTTILEGKVVDFISNKLMNHTAEEYVHRIEPHAGTNPGLLYLACTAEAVQPQIKARATGSVVDGLSEADVREIVVPYPTGQQADELGDAVVAAWRQLDEAIALEDEAIAALESELMG
jgi:hypothetical protein